MNFKERLTQIKAFAFDVDGVFSQECIYLHPSGELMRSMNTKDGYAVVHAIEKGYKIAIITGGANVSVRKRFEYLRVKDIYQSSDDKLRDLKHFAERYQLNAKQILYMGDDIVDYEAMQSVGVPACPADAVEEIKSISRYISDKNGGRGCVRDVIEQVMRSQAKWYS